VTVSEDRALSLSRLTLGSRAVAARRRRRFHPLRWGVSPFLAGTDLAAAAVATLCAGTSLRRAVLFTAIALVLNSTAGLYRSRLALSVLDDAPRLVGRGLAAATLTMAIDVIGGYRKPGTALLVAAGLYAVGVVLLRTAAYIVVRSVRRAHRISHRTLVIGAGEVGGRLVRVLRDHSEYGLQPVGFLDSDPLLDESQREVPLLGGHDDLAAVIQRYEIGEAIIAFGAEREASMVDVLRTCDRLNCEIFLVPRLFEMYSGSGQTADSAWGIPLVRMHRAAFRSASWRIKRAFDVVVAAVALTLACPLLLAIAVAVRWEGRGVLFRQERVGLDGRPFQLLKFRSLRPADDDEAATLWNLLHDDRVSRLGRLLRRTSLDELPQLWNVLVGDMSLVGPRPERPYFVAQFSEKLPRYTHRHRVPAGLTGWAQVHGLRGDTSIDERAQFDNYYIENWSLWLDIKILLRTTLSLFHRTG
jgi:exopolysaccharide biosynthesis polyprenyl glycosylphosphotransferase